MANYLKKENKMRPYNLIFISLCLFFVNIVYATERQEIISKRTYQSKTYANADGTYSLELSTGYMHYKNEQGEFLEINPNFVFSTYGDYNYAVTKGLHHTYFKSDLTQSNPVMFETKDGFQLGMKLTGVAYLDVSTKNYHILQNIQSTNAYVNGNEILYQNAFSNVDVKYIYKDTRLKEEIYISQVARNSLPNPSNFGLNSASTYLVFITKLQIRDSTNINYYANNQNITNTAYEGEGRIKFKNLRGKLKYFFPVDIAFMEAGRDSSSMDEFVKVRKRIIRKNGKLYLLAGIPLSAVNSFPAGTIVLDPQIAIQPASTAGKDSYVYKYERTGYDFCANTNYDGSETHVAKAWTGSGYPRYYRTFLEFDMTTLPGNAKIDSARLDVYWPDLGVQHSGGTYSRYSIASTYIRRVLENWSENSITWNNQPDDTTLNQVSVDAPSTGTSDFSANVTEIVKDMLRDGNYGFMWRLQTEQYWRGMRFGSSDHTVSSKRPKLTINYTTLEKYYYLKDHLGNIRVTIDEEGDVVGYDDYYPFGLQMPGRTYNLSLTNDIYKYSGKELDEENNLDWYYFGARYYDPAIARWLQVDPLASKYPSLSPYNYVSNNPLNAIDPDGRSIKPPPTWLSNAYNSFRGAVTNVVNSLKEYGGVAAVAGEVIDTMVPENVTMAAVQVQVAGLGMTAGLSSSTVQATPANVTKVDYTVVKDNPSVAPGKKFTQTQKTQIKEVNKSSNSGTLRSDISGKKLVQPKQHKKGVTPPKNEAHVDHIKPKSSGGTNSSSNAQVISREENLIKSNN